MRDNSAAIDRLKLMFSAGNQTASTKGNGSGTRGLFKAWDLGWLKPVGPLGRPTLWEITDAGEAVLAASRDAA